MIMLLTWMALKMLAAEAVNNKATPPPAGRVQSVTLKMISERDAQIEAFHSEEYWSVQTELEVSQGVKLNASVVEASLLYIHSGSAR